MSAVNAIFEKIHLLAHEEGQNNFISLLLKQTNENPDGTTNKSEFNMLQTLLHNIFQQIDDLATVLRNDETILISVRNQKLLRTCFQLVSSLGISVCLIPGLGINLSKRCASAVVLPPICLTDQQKYEILVACTDFFTRSYEVPVLKNIITTLHLTDYLAALIQLSFAPLKKPGIYNNFTMTQDLYDQLNQERNKFVQTYKKLVINCFQPTLMKELLVLQSVTDPSPPVFVKRIIAKEMSQRLLVSGGLLSLIRCFIESYNIDTGFEWKKIDMICKIVATKHGNDSQDVYLKNICAQLMQILSSNNTHYLATAVACVLSLNDKYPQSVSVHGLQREIFQAFDYNSLVSQSALPGTVILSPQEVEHKVNVLHACVCTTKLDWPITLLLPNLYILYLLGVKCDKNEELNIKLKDIIVKSLVQLNKNEVYEMVKSFLFGIDRASYILIDQFNVGLTIKYATSEIEHPKTDAVLYFLHLFKSATDNILIQNIYEASLMILIDLSSKRQKKASREHLLAAEDEAVLLDDVDEHYASILQLLSEMSTSPKVVLALKSNPTIVFHFIEYFILKQQTNANEECVTIALVLLNTILLNANKSVDSEIRFSKLIPVLKEMAENESNYKNILCKEALNLMSSAESEQTETEYGKAVSDIFNHLLPLRAHGIIKLTKLIDSKDPETISKKHYVFCLLQEQLKDPDSYIYLSAINGIASLGTHCTEDVLQVLCNQFLKESSEPKTVVTKESQQQTAELKMKIGDTIVKVTKRLGEIAVVHKTILLNTMLCGCRDEDPLLRTSALSNLAEIALVLHYRIGSIIYEVLLCIWSIIETDKAIECRRAAVMVISSLLKGLGKETLTQLKENLLPIYRSLRNIYRDTNEDSIVRLHAQLALEELNDAVNQFLLPELNMEKQFFVEDKHEIYLNKIE